MRTKLSRLNRNGENSQSHKNKALAAGAFLAAALGFTLLSAHAAVVTTVPDMYRTFDMCHKPNDDLVVVGPVSSTPGTLQVAEVAPAGNVVATSLVTNSVDTASSARLFCQSDGAVVLVYSQYNPMGFDPGAYVRFNSSLNQVGAGTLPSGYWLSACELPGGNLVVGYAAESGSLSTLSYIVIGAGDQVVASGDLSGTGDQVSRLSGIGAANAPDIACLPSDRFLFAWQPDTTHAAFARLFAADGTPLGAKVQVNGAESPAEVGFPRVGVDGSGNVLLAWSGLTDNPLYSLAPFSADVYAQRFDANGAPIGTAFQVTNLSPAGLDYSVRGIAGSPGGGFVLGLATGRHTITDRWNFGMLCNNAAILDSSGSVLGTYYGEEEVNDGFPTDGYAGYMGASPTTQGVGIAAYSTLRRLVSSEQGGADGVLECGEVCDDANLNRCDGCYQNVVEAAGSVCGDSIVSAACAEQCDDGNSVAGDGCSRCVIDVVVSQTVGAGGTLATAASTSPAQPSATGVTTPSGGAVGITETGTGDLPGFSAVGRVIDITAPAESVANPLILTFEFDSSIIPAGIDANTITLRRNGAALGDCTGAPQAVPDPCIAARQNTANGIRLTALTSHASQWSAGAPLCGTMPRATCRTGVKSVLGIKDDPNNDSKDKITWKLTGDIASPSEFGDPSTKASLALCIYSAEGRVGSINLAPAGTCGKKPCWKFKKGSYVGTTPTLTGKAKARLKAAQGTAHVSLNGRGAALGLPNFPALTGPVIAQLVNSANDVCWQDSYDERKIRTNMQGKFKAKTP